ncbi:MAG: peptidylprolyl isomerase [Sedimentisphaerales bacterium]|nr:peptidylprolyl isomerase [Sedimentisphaerales bacterium]
MKKAHYSILMVLMIMVFALAGTLHADKSIVLLETNYGDITVELYDDDTPITVENFLGYVQSDFYEGLIFHRVLDEFMIQAGAYDPNLYDLDFTAAVPDLQDPCFFHQPNDPIELEASSDRKNLRGTIAMARTSEPNSATSQFFINLVDNPHLDAGYGGQPGYAVFGTVSDGMDVVDDIADVAIIDDPNVTSYFEALPVEPVIIESASVIHELDPNNLDFSDVPFLNATAGVTRTFIGQGSFEGLSYTHQFSSYSVSGVDCLRWQQVFTTSLLVDNFDICLVRDLQGEIRVLKYYLNGEKIYRITSQYESKPLSEFADDNMYFKLIAGEYDPNDLNSSDNTATSEENGVITTEQIKSFEAGLDHLTYYDDNIVLAKRTEEPCQPLVEWSYYNESVGLVLDLWNTSEQEGDPNYFDPNLSDTAETNLDGWRLAYYGQEQPTFEADSYDFSEVPFLKAKPGDLRIYRGQGAFTDSEYQVLFSMTELLGVRCLKIEQTAVGEWGKPGSTIYAAKDSEENLWVLKVESDGEIVFDAEFIDQIAPFEKYPDMHLRLMTGDYDEQTIITTDADEQLESAEIVGLTESLESLPQYNDELVLVKLLHGADGEDIGWQYYNESAGMVLDIWEDFAEPNNIDPNAYGWYLAEPCSIEDVKTFIWAGYNRDAPADTFYITGKLTAQKEDFEQGSLLLRFGSYQVEIPTDNPLGGWAGSRLIFIHSPAGTSSTSSIWLSVDLTLGTFWLYGLGVDLSGLDEPVILEMVVGDFYGAGTAEIIGSGNVPIILLRGYKDVLRKKWFSFVYDDYGYSDGVTIWGEIATKEYPVDLTQTTISINWGSSNTFTISPDDTTRIRKLYGERYYYYDPWGELTMAYFDLELGTYRVSIKKSFLAKPPQDFSVKFEDDQDNVLFNQTVSVP